MKTKIIPITTLIALLIIAPALSGCGQDETVNMTDGHDDHREETSNEHDGEEEHITLSPEALKTIGIETAPVELRTIGGEIKTTAVIEPDRTRIAHVSPRISGRVTDVSAYLGDNVENGQILAELDSIELGQAKAEYLKSKANLEVSQANYQRENRLYKKEISSEKEYLDARGEFHRSEANLNTARETLRLLGLTDEEIKGLRWTGGEHPPSHFPLTAPFAGTVIEQHIVTGELIKPEDKPYTIADLSHLWIQLDVYEKDLGLITSGTGVSISADAYPDEKFEGTVTYISDIVDASTRTAKARVEIENADRKLKPGMFATAEISLPGSGSGKVVAVPSRAVQQIRGKPAAFVVESEDEFQMREIVTGRDAGEYVEILSGLSPGERVVTDGGFYLKSLELKEEMGEGHGH